MTQAVILAGGKGTRLASVLGGIPKCLVDVDGKPLLRHQIELLKRYGINEIVILVNHASEYIAEYLRGNSFFGIQIRLLDDGSPRGTAGAILSALDHLKDRFLVLYGDTLLNVDLRRMLDIHESSHADATLFLHPNDHPSDSDLVEIDEEDWITAFHPYPREMTGYYPNLVNAALYIMEKRMLERWRAFRSPSDFGKDLFPAMISAGARLKGYHTFEYIKDVGTPGRLARAVTQLRDGTMTRASISYKQKAVFLDRDGTLNEHRGFVRSLDDFTLLPSVAEAIKSLNLAEYRVVVVTNQPVIARGEATFREVKQMHNKLETELGEAGAFIDRIYFCPHHPDTGFEGEVAELKMRCDCRKPNIEMINRAARELNIDLGHSWMVGDSTVDIETARRAGLRSVLVRTGEAGRDMRYAISADAAVDTLSEAVNLILAQQEVADDY